VITEYAVNTEIVIKVDFKRKRKNKKTIPKEGKECELRYPHANFPGTAKSAVHI
jgi:hypothetical protein